MESTQQEPITSDLKNFPALRDRLHALKMLQREYVRVEADFHRKIYELDIDYQQMRHQIYERRKDVVNGGGEMCPQVPTEIEQEVAKALEKMNFNDETENAKGIPNFWLQALKNCTYSGDLIQDCDEEALKYLRDIRVNLTNEPKLSFTLEFEFEPNPFFEKSTLTKQYFLSCDNDDDCYGISIVKTIGCEIDWKENKNIVEKDAESFFTFFSPPETPESENDSIEIGSAIFFELQQDFEIGLFIKEKLIPSAVLYYLNEIDEVVEGCAAFGDADEAVISKMSF